MAHFHHHAQAQPLCCDVSSAPTVDVGADVTDSPGADPCNNFGNINVHSAGTRSNTYELFNYAALTHQAGE